MPGIEHILTNPFLNATKGSCERAFILGTFTDGALRRPGVEPEIAALYDAYHPVFADFKERFLTRTSRRGEGKSKTFAQRVLLQELSGHIKDWGLRIEMVHRRDTPAYLTFLPRGRKPFRSGKIDSRASAVLSLSLSLQTEPALSDLRLKVEAFYAQLAAAISGAEGAKSLKGASRHELEEARIALCHALYAVLGGLIRLYPDQPDRAKAYFDIATLHRHRHRKVEGIKVKIIEPTTDSAHDGHIALQ